MFCHSERVLKGKKKNKARNRRVTSDISDKANVAQGAIGRAKT
ncbi:hypothetical protein [Wolbachia pipientis]|nr:hypothetical protein [Wolbachia pipientis]